MTTIVGIAGSARQGSYNRALLGAAVEIAPPEVTLDAHDIGGIPLYDGDLEAEQGIPERVTELKDLIAAADGLLLASPEYNNSLPGPMKNAIDWLTRPPKDIGRVFGDRPVGLIGATPGRGGTRLAQTAWLPVFRTLSMRPWFGKNLYVAGAGQLFDDQLRLTDDTTRTQLAEYVRGFVEFVEGCRTG
ncbi:MAG: NADPH-dependent FMN reductase [Myxococcota bacterium]